MLFLSTILKASNWVCSKDENSLEGDPRISYLYVLLVNLMHSQTGEPLNNASIIFMDIINIILVSNVQFNWSRAVDKVSGARNRGMIPNQALYFSLSTDYRTYCFVQHPRTLQIWPQHPPPASPPSTISSQTYLTLASTATGVYPMWPQGGNWDPEVELQGEYLGML